MTSARVPLAVARIGVGLAARVLPAPADRARYRAEFLAELHGLAGARQLRYAAGVLLHSFALRAALGAGATEEDAMTPAANRVPFWRCRVFRWHDWVVRRTADGGRFEQCARCGRDRGPISVLATTTPPWPGN